MSRIRRHLFSMINCGVPLYPRRLSACRSVDKIVMNSKASLALGVSKNKRLNEVATLDHSNYDHTTEDKTNSLIHVRFYVVGQPDLEGAFTGSWSDGGRSLSL